MFKYRLDNPQLAREGNIVDRRVIDRPQADATNFNLFSFLQAKHPNGTKLTLEEVERECFILTIGAQDTMASFMSAFVNHILDDPTIHSKLVTEIASFEGRGQLSSPVVRFDETGKMPYFMACLQETLRLSPSVSMILPRYAPTGGMFIGKTWVSQKTEIAANPYVLHRNTDIFGLDAETFRPERWLGDPEQVRLMHKYFFAFGYGSRRCLGKNIAMFISQKFLVQVWRPPPL